MEVYKKEATELEEQLLILRKQGRPEEILQFPDYWKLRSFIRIPTTLQLHYIFRHIMNFQEEITKNVFSTAFKVRNTVKKMNI